MASPSLTVSIEVLNLIYKYVVMMLPVDSKASVVAGEVVAVVVAAAVVAAATVGTVGETYCSECSFLTVRILTGAD